ncbi:MAG: hypothetical protein V7679_16065 [Parasphingorhabdus sp.]
MNMKLSGIIKAATGFTAVAIFVFSLPTSVSAFGTITRAGQNAEHGRITRHALACQPDSAAGSCFDEKTLDSLAGKPGSFGAVGAPDRGRGMLTSYAHCSGGDYFDIPGYPQSLDEARAVLEECRGYMADNLAHAVADAASLLNDQGEIRSREVSMTFSCIYKGSTHGRAKCDILAHLGRILHASQDFYTHSNWVDQADAQRPISSKNPPGLGNRRLAPWLDLRDPAPVFPVGLISGCFDNVSFLDEAKGCLYGENGDHRVRHGNLNKDLGTIDPVIGNGTTERGAMNDNFRHAVEAAISDSADKWATYKELVVAAYGEARGGKMICALTSDSPAKAC